jgi:death-on-curing protein
LIFLEMNDLLHIAARVIGAEPVVRDAGLLASALARPSASVFGQDAYPTIHDKAAALLLSLARNHGLVDRNKRLALGGVLAFYGMNGLRLTLTNAEAFELVSDVAAGDVDLTDLSTPLSESTGPWKSTAR